ncbi:MAG: hypothetical protein HRT66_07280 [Flavobacteriaceae bacterium]|nr:hypothetical protein [Flavobacteriaceae bacterium]
MKYIKNIILTGLMLGSLVACEDNEDYALGGSSVGGSISGLTSKIHHLAPDADLTVTYNLASGVTVAGVKVEVEQYSRSGGNVVLNDDDEPTMEYVEVASTATFSASVLGDHFFFVEPEDNEDAADVYAYLNDNANKTGLTGTYHLRVTTTLSNGLVLVDTSSAKVTEYFKVSDMTVVALSTAESKLEYDSNGEAAESITIEWKLNDGVYVSLDLTDLANDEGNIDFTSFDDSDNVYGASLFDTVYFKFTATTGSNTSSKTIEVDVDSQYMGGSSDMSVISSYVGEGSVYTFGVLDLSTGAMIAAGETGGDIMFKNDSPGEEFVSVVDSGVELMSFSPAMDSSDEDLDTQAEASAAYFSAGDMIQASRDFVAGNTSFASLTKGELCIYKVTRSVLNLATKDDKTDMIDKVHYGIIRIGDMTNVQSGDDYTMTYDLSVKEGYIVE